MTGTIQKMPATHDIVPTAGSKVTINWYRCKQSDFVTVIELDVTASSALTADDLIASDLPSIGGNAQAFWAHNATSLATTYGLKMTGSAISSVGSIPSGTRFKTVFCYFAV